MCHSVSAAGNAGHGGEAFRKGRILVDDQQSLCGGGIAIGPRWMLHPYEGAEREDWGAGGRRRGGGGGSLSGHDGAFTLTKVRSEKTAERVDGRRRRRGGQCQPGVASRVSAPRWCR